MATDIYEIENNSDVAYDVMRGSHVRVDELIGRRFVGINVVVDDDWAETDLSNTPSTIITLELEEEVK